MSDNDSKLGGGGSKQDMRSPLLINVKNARLLPNTPRLRIHPDMRVYTGSPKASQEERERYLTTGHTAPAVTSNDGAVFDIGAATKEELVRFAAEQYGAELSTDTDIRTLRRSVNALASAGTAELT